MYGIIIIEIPTIKKAYLIKYAIWLRCVSYFVKPVRLWWKRKEKTKFENISPKKSILKKAFPFLGSNDYIYPFWNMIIIDPIIIKLIEINLTTIMINCNTLVLSILLNEKAAPDMKNRLSQN